jgi:hypothetical protein
MQAVAETYDRLSIRASQRTFPTGPDDTPSQINAAGFLLGVARGLDPRIEPAHLVGRRP